MMNSILRTILFGVLVTVFCVWASEDIRIKKQKVAVMERFFDGGIQFEFGPHFYEELDKFRECK